jgi:site-specific DNA-methyltransferase (cytosine-N4-specific)
VLEPYAQSTLKHFIGKPGKKMTRASGYTFGETSWSKDNGGKIPSNLIVAKHGGGPRGYYRERCRETGLPEHPAMFPDAVPERGILLTTDIGDVVYDPMAGSGKTAEVAERLGRRWITSEKALAYVLGESFRFEQLPSFRMHPLPAGL